MARIRSIHPEACDSEKLAALSDSAERTFFRLLTHTDDEGRAEDRPKLLAAKLYPLHDGKSAETVDTDLADIESVGLLVRYSVEGRCYLAFPTFGDWQKPRHPTPSRLPAPEEDDGSATDNSVSPTAERGKPTDTVRPGDGDGGGDGGGGGDGDSPEGGADAPDPPAATNGHDKRSFTDRCADWLDGQGITLPPADRQLERRRMILQCVLDEAGDDRNRQRQASMGIVRDYVADLTGSQIPGEAGDLLARLVGDFGGVAVLDAVGEAMTWGAGLGEAYRDDPLALAKYVSAVLHGETQGAA